jgi:hypothetical protein
MRRDPFGQPGTLGVTPEERGDRGHRRIVPEPTAAANPAGRPEETR